jgi:hypothetical protein
VTAQALGCPTCGDGRWRSVRRRRGRLLVRGRPWRGSWQNPTARVVDPPASQRAYWPKRRCPDPCHRQLRERVDYRLGRLMGLGDSKPTVPGPVVGRRRSPRDEYRVRKATRGQHAKQSQSKERR